MNEMMMIWVCVCACVWRKINKWTRFQMQSQSLCRWSIRQRAPSTDCRFSLALSAYQSQESRWSNSVMFLHFIKTWQKKRCTTQNSNTAHQNHRIQTQRFTSTMEKQKTIPLSQKNISRKHLLIIKCKLSTNIVLHMQFQLNLKWCCLYGWNKICQLSIFCF